MPSNAQQRYFVTRDCGLFLLAAARWDVRRMERAHLLCTRWMRLSASRCSRLARSRACTACTRHRW